MALYIPGVGRQYKQPKEDEEYTSGGGQVESRTMWDSGELPADYVPILNRSEFSGGSSNPKSNVNPEFARNFPTLNSFLDTVTTPLQKVFNNPFVERSSQTAGETMFLTDNPNKVSTGSAGWDMTADLLGGLGGFVANPAGMGNAGMEAFNLGTKAATKYLPSTMPGIGKAALGMGAGGLTYEGARAALSDRPFDPAEMGTAVGMNALIGGVTHGAIRGVPKFFDTSMPKIDGLNLSPEVRQLALPQGRSMQALPPGRVAGLIPDHTTGAPYRQPAGEQRGLLPEYGQETQGLINKAQQETQDILSTPLLPRGKAEVTDAPTEILGLPKPQTEPVGTMRMPDAYGKAEQELNDGIKKAQDYVQHNDILAAYPPGTTVEAAMADIKAKIGVDLPALIAKVEEAKAMPGLRETAINDIENTRMGQVAGVYNTPTKLKRGASGYNRVIGEQTPQPIQRITADRTPELNVARTILKKPIKVETAEKIFATYPELRSEFPGISKRVERAQANRLKQQTKVQQQPIQKPTQPQQAVNFEVQNAINILRSNPSPEKAQAVLRAYPELAKYYKPPKVKQQKQQVMAENMAQPSVMPENMTKQSATSKQESYSMEVPVFPKEIAKEDVRNLNSTDNWQDKSKLLQKRETMIRNFEDVMGEDAPNMIKEYLDPVGVSEAEAIRFMNKERQEIASLGIKARSKESELVQKYGEGGWSEVVRDKTGKVISEKKHAYTIDDLKLERPNDWQKIKNAAEVIKEKYKNYLSTVNEVLARNGYDPIPERPDYMRHFQEMTGIFEKFGIPKKAEELPVDLNGLTDNFKPGKNFFANALKRKGNETTLDAITGIDGYIEGISRLIYHTDNIQRLRGLSDGLRGKYEGTNHLSRFVSELDDYTNILAGKKTRLDRGDEELLDRSVYKYMDWLRSQNARNLATSVSSAMTNFIPLTQSIATTSKPSVIKAFGETMLNYLKNDGFVNASDFLIRRIGSDPLSLTLWQKAGDKSFFMMRAADNFVSQLVVRGKYNELVSKGIKPEFAIKRADQYAARVMGDRSRGGMPTLFHARGLKGFFLQFQLEVNNQLSFLTNDIPRHHEIEIAGKKVPKTLAVGLALTQVALFSKVFNDAFEKLAGYRPAIDPIGSFEKAKREKNDPTISAEKWWVNLAGDIAKQLPFASTLTGGRIPLSSAMPDIKAPFDKEKTTSEKIVDTLERPAFYLLPPGLGGQARKTWKGANALEEGGVYSRKGNLMYPTDPKEVTKTLLFGPNSTPEAKDYWDKGRNALYPNQTKEYKDTFEKGKNKKGQTAREQYNELRKNQDTGNAKKQVEDIDKEIKELIKQGGKGEEIKKLRQKRSELVKWIEGRK